MNYGAIRSILLTVILLSASCAAFGTVSGTAVSAILFASAACFMVRESRWSRSVRIAAVVLGLSAMVCLVLPALNAARETARCMHCANNLKQIGLALRSYWDCHGCFPPACTYDRSGRPMHSWRLLIKPFLDGSTTYSYCNFTEPWDSPSNRRLLADRQSVYKCLTDETAWRPDSTATSYVAIVGSRARWRSSKAESTDQELHNHAADTFLVIEMANSGIQWPEPKDIRFDDIQALRSLAAASSHAHNNGYFFCKTPAVNAVLVHGDMVFLFPWDSTMNVLTGLLPPEEPSTGTEHGPKYDPFAQLYREELQVDWPHCVGLPIWIVAVGLLSYQVASARLTVCYGER